MSDSAEIKKLKIKIEELENEIADAKKEKRSEAYLIVTKNELVELRKKENILLEKSQKIGTCKVFVWCYILFVE